MSPALHTSSVVLLFLSRSSVKHASADGACACMQDSPAGGLYAPVEAGKLTATAVVSASTAMTRALEEGKAEPAMMGARSMARSVE